MTQRLISPVQGLGRPVINRSQRISFVLDGVEIRGYTGDTVLSAALAAGIEGAGSFGGSPVCLGSDFAPLVRAWADKDSAGVPMALCPAEDGTDLVTVGSRGWVMRRIAAQLRNRAPHNLAIDLEKQPIGDIAAEVRPVGNHADLVVVGGGVAGMSAALTAAERGERVMLVERRSRLGGDALLFGNKEGEKPVLEVIDALETAIAARSEIEVRLLCDAVDANAEGVRLHRIATGENGPVLAAERISARRVVLATGCADRLGVFPGNRLPGVVGLAEAFYLAGTFGIWPEAPTLFAGGTNALYNLAMLAKESGAELVRLIDHRVAPHSRFIDFAKATGVRQEFGTRIAAIGYGSRGRLAIETELSENAQSSEGRAVFAAGSVVQSDGWRPRLNLWTRLGETVSWDNGARANDGGRDSGIVLAGSVTGLASTTGCLQSGERAIARLFGDHGEPIVENLLADYLESPDALPLMAKPSEDEFAFVSSKSVLVAMPVSKTGRRRNRGAAPGPGTAGMLDLETIETLTRAGLTPAERFADICAERLVSPETIHASVSTSNGASAADGIPAYVLGRFAEPLVRVELNSEDGRRFEPGMLVFIDSGQQAPEQAAGVVIGATGSGGIAVLGADTRDGITHVAVRDSGRMIVAEIAG